MVINPVKLHIKGSWHRMLMLGHFVCQCISPGIFWVLVLFDSVLACRNKCMGWAFGIL